MAGVEVEALVLGELEIGELDEGVELALAEQTIRELDVEDKLVELGVADAGAMLLGDAEDEAALLEDDEVEELGVLLKLVDAVELMAELLDSIAGKLELLENM